MRLTDKKRLLSLYAIAAKHRLDAHLPNHPALAGLKRLIRLHPLAIGKKPKPMGVKLALEEMGTLFLKLGQLLSTRSDLLPPAIIEQLSLLQDQVAPFDSAIARLEIEQALGGRIDELFARFDNTPFAAASIAQVHTAKLKNGREVVVKVVRPTIKATILADFELLRYIAHFVSARVAMARAIHLSDIVEDYRQIMLDELDLTIEARNSQKMRQNFLNSPLIYVPKVYQATSQVMVSERIYGLPISRLDDFDRLGYDKATLAKTGLTIFFTQVFYHNFFHADMHPGNIFVETLPNGDAVLNPRYIGLDCAIMGELSAQDQLVVARLLLAVMNSQFDLLVEIIAQAGWVPPSVDKHALTKDMTRTVSPMVSKPMSEIDFAGVLYAILDVARRHHMTIPPQLVLLLKTLVHVEGLGRELYPELDIWQLAKPILTDWVKEQFDPAKNLYELSQKLPETLLASANLPHLVFDGVQSLAMMGSRQELLVRELQQLHQDSLNNKRYDWLALGGFGISLAIGLVVPFWWLSLGFFGLGAVCVLWRITV